MGKPFWKFFFFIWLAQLATIWGVGAAAWLYQPDEGTGGIDGSRPAAFLVEAAVNTLQNGGPEALKNLLKTSGRRPVYVVNEQGQDILARPVEPAIVEKAKQAAHRRQPSQTIREITFSGQSYLVFSPDPDLPPVTPFDDRPPSRLFPAIPVITATIASLILAALLAWYLSKPIRSLRSAIKVVADGHFDVDRLPGMESQRGDLAGLGQDFDPTAASPHALMEGQRRLLHDISHELRSPLARLQASIGLIRQQPEKWEASLVRIERECVRMDKLIGELLTLSKLEAGVTLGVQQPINFSELLEDVVSDSRFEAGTHGKDVEIHGQYNVEVLGNGELLHQAIENVLRNAIRHTPTGTSVMMEIQKDPERPVLHMAIRDEGPGVPEPELALIFEPFYRSAATKGSGEGYGLGLAIARRTIEAHGGSIRAQNRSTAGLRVDITIPVSTLLPAKPKENEK